MRHNDLPTPHAVLGGLAHSGINGNIQSSYEVFGFACWTLRRIANLLIKPTQTFPNLKVDSRDLAMSTMRGLHNIITPSGGEGGRSRHECVLSLSSLSLCLAMLILIPTT